MLCFLVGSMLFIFFFSFLVLSYYVSLRFEFRIKPMFGSSLPPVVCRRTPVLFMLLVFFGYSGVQHILCCVLFFFVLLPVSLARLSFFFIVPSVFSNVYFQRSF